MAAKNAKTPKKKIQKRTIVPDTSVVAEALLSKYINSGKLKFDNLIIHRAVLDELEHQANQGRETGFVGLREIERLQEMCKGVCEIRFDGPHPGEFEIRHAKSGAVDAMIRELARKEQALLLTADRVQALVAKAQGIDVELVRFHHDHHSKHDDNAHDPLAEFFDETTMSVHFKEGADTMSKKGKPGAWDFIKIGDAPDNEWMRKLADNIVESAHARRDGFIEIERRGSTIVQLGKYRIVIAKPPFSSAWEVTAVRPVAHLSLGDYKFPEKFQERLEKNAEGILVAGSPGEGKSTFAQAVGEFYANRKKIVKTVEAPRDLVVPSTITQYSKSHGSPEEIRDVLLLNRPDYTIYDEIRNTEDFLLFADMRLSGVGMIGVVHATTPVDSIQRFIGRVELGMVPHIIDTVVFIKAGGIDKVFSLEITVKVPSGMTEADLARPVVLVKDFYTDKAEFEIYTYGDQTTVVPVTEDENKTTAVFKFAQAGFEDYFSQFSTRARVEILSENKIRVHVPENIVAKMIGKAGKHIQEIQEELGVSIDVVGDGGGQAKSPGGNIRWEANVGKRNITLELPPKYANQEVDLMDQTGLITHVITSKTATIRISPNSPVGKRVQRALERDKLEIHA